MDIVEALKSNILVSIPLEGIINVFCTVNEIFSFDNSEYIFDSGIYESTCDEMFNFSLIREYKENNILNRICVDVVFPPDCDNYKLSDYRHFSSHNDFKNYVLATNEYKVLKHKNILKINIYQD